MRIEAESAVPKVLMQNDLAIVVKAHMGDAEGVTRDLCAKWGEVCLHGPNQVNVAVALQCLVNLHIDPRACIAQSCKVIDDRLFVSSNHESIAEMQRLSVQRIGRRTSGWVAQIGEKVHEALNGYRGDVAATGKLFECLSVLGWVLRSGFVGCGNVGAAADKQAQDAKENRVRRVNLH